jgi:hypothetical protein
MIPSPEFIPVYFYPTVEDAIAPLSAGTFGYREVYYVPLPGTVVAQEATVAESPHPVWTNGMGKAIVQIDMCVLGGPNGLNA